MSTAIRNTYNFAPSFCYFVPKYMADLLTRDYNKDTIDLSDIDVHNGIEHDGSLFRKILAGYGHSHFITEQFYYQDMTPSSSQTNRKLHLI